MDNAFAVIIVWVVGFPFSAGLFVLAEMADNWIRVKYDIPRN